MPKEIHSEIQASVGASVAEVLNATYKGRDAPTERDSINVPASSHQVTGNVHRLSLWGRTAKIE
ncbi:hypothetical protein FOIG_03449 [Fusarium odoratissimum NRRL 54006]|uniref:Uncharacterized protein n=2 Tax=Fusarium oxysporum species complex TaxID=171631 RepID=X0KDF2_FUSO5|nr:uncharacterized protein FOIG_03449 [Fusarium odoratissimum NRRL 54006]EXM06747.1 hypothetical protein FOIG_03449 [Fusarium odoratissimum NRRL 54006]TXC08146.1 hypothetical protein FocTR4_00002922 [Fusarium oxysporum f. sp. cubense]